MTDTAPEYHEPELDLDAMLADLQAGFPAPTAAEPASPADAGEEEPVEEAISSTESSSTETPEIPDTSDLLPPGMVQFGDEVLPLEEAQALLELNRRVKDDPEKARRVREAVLGEARTPVEESLPEWLNPDDDQAVFLFKQQQRINAELAEIKNAEARRQQQFEQDQAETRKQQVITAYRSAIVQFSADHPEFDPEHVKGLTDEAYRMHLLDDPAKLDPEGSLTGGFLRALDTAVWATPQYRDLALAGGTVKSKAEQASERKQKQSALSSSTGSTPRSNQVPRATTRQEIMANMLDDLRAGLTD